MEYCPGVVSGCGKIGGLPLMLEQYDKKKIAGCMGFGCLLTVLLFGLGGAGAYFGIKAALSSMVYKYTEAVPMDMPKVNLSEVEKLTAENKLKRFGSDPLPGASDDGSVLELTANEVNYLIQSGQPMFKELKDRFHFEIEGGKLKSQLSVPLDGSGVKDLRRRYLNGTAEIDFAIKNEKLEFNVSNLIAKGSKIPEGALQVLQSQGGILTKIRSRPEFQKIAKYIKEFKVAGDQVHIELKDGVNRAEMRSELGIPGVSL